VRIDEYSRFERVEIGRKSFVGHFKLSRAVGDLAYAAALFVVEEGGAGRVWPLAVVTCLYAVKN